MGVSAFVEAVGEEDEGVAWVEGEGVLLVGFVVDHACGEAAACEVGEGGQPTPSPLRGGEWGLWM